MRAVCLLHLGGTTARRPSYLLGLSRPVASAARRRDPPGRWHHLRGELDGMGRGHRLLQSSRRRSGGGTGIPTHLRTAQRCGRTGGQAPGWQRPRPQRHRRPTIVGAVPGLRDRPAPGRPGRVADVHHHLPAGPRAHGAFGALPAHHARRARRSVRLVRGRAGALPVANAWRHPPAWSASRLVALCDGRPRALSVTDEEW